WEKVHHEPHSPREQASRPAAEGSETMTPPRSTALSVLSRRSLLVNGAAMATVAALPNRSTLREEGTVSQASATQPGGISVRSVKIPVASTAFPGEQYQPHLPFRTPSSAALARFEEGGCYVRNE